MKMIREQLAWMLDRQDYLNTLVNGDWRQKALPWWRPTWFELSEMLGHLNRWQWWKRYDDDLPHATIELVDAWHFAMSDWLARYNDMAQIVEEFMQQWTKANLEGEDVVAVVEDAITSIIASRAVPLAAIVAVTQSFLGKNFSRLYSVYRGKAVLNEFRSKHGYQQGAYDKCWWGKEDNIWLITLLRHHQAYPGDQWLYEALSELYTHRKEASYEEVLQRCLSSETTEGPATVTAAG